jgi:hypothetical protein
MPTITVSDQTFAKLQALAEPFVDTPETVIEQLLSYAPDAHATGNSRFGVAKGAFLLLDPDAPESLRHTRLLAARVGEIPLHRPKWNGLLDFLHVAGMKKLGSFDELQAISGANLKKGRYEENGYRYLPEAGLSIQGVDAILAWQHSLKLARALKVEVELKLEWRQKEGAARPGEVALLRSRVGPTQGTA